MTRYMAQPSDSNLCVPISFFNLLLWAGYKRWKGYPVDAKLAKETLPKIFNTDSKGTNFYDYISIFKIKSGKLRLIKDWDYFPTRYREFKRLLSHKNYCAVICAEYCNVCHMFMIESFTPKGKFKCINLFNGITVDYIHSKTVARWFRKRKVLEAYIFEKTR